MREVFEFKGGGVALAMYNLDESIRGFARASMNYGLHAQLARSISRPRTRSSRPTTGASRTSSSRSSTTEFKAEFEQRGLTYEHRLIDDMVAAALKWSGAFVWACKNYDGDVQSDTVAQGFGSLGPDDVGADDARRQDDRGRGGARHGDAALPRAPEGPRDVDQPDRVDLRVDARARAPRQGRRHAGRHAVRRDARDASASRPSRRAR